MKNIIEMKGKANDGVLNRDDRWSVETNIQNSCGDDLIAGHNGLVSGYQRTMQMIDAMEESERKYQAAMNGLFSALSVALDTLAGAPNGQ